MLVNIHHDSPKEHLRLFVSGIAFLLTMAMLVGLSIAIYNKTFSRDKLITIKADRAGLQLGKFGDVRRNGALIGSVRAVEEVDNQAQITVAIQPDALEAIPENVEVQILPTTLFGQKFISFVDPDQPAADSLAPDAVIPANRVETNVELSRIMANLFPLLRSINPYDLNVTLTALADALQGRGEQMGVTMEKLGAYLGEIQGSLPTLREDLIKLADVANTYDVAAPDLIRMLDNLTVTSRTIIDKRRALDVFFSDLTGLANTSSRILANNEQAMIRLGEVSAPVMKLLATYSPEFPCLIRGAARYAPLLAKTFEGNQVKQFVTTGTPQYGPYTAADLPEYGEVGHGPWCSGLPNPPIPIGPNAFNDGTLIDDNPPTSSLPRSRTAPEWAGAEGFADGMSSGYAGSPGEQEILNALLADQSGKAADSYGSLGSLLYGPVMRGGATP